VLGGRVLFSVTVDLRSKISFTISVSQNQLEIILVAELSSFQSRLVGAA
jgi:hypothetical protein